MQMVKKTIIIILSAIIALLVFAPKKNLYYFLEGELKKSGIVLSDETITESPIGLNISNAKVYVENTYIGDIKDISILTLLAYNRVTVTGFNPTESIKKMLPISVDKAEMEYVVSNPMEVSILIEGSMGKATGKVDLAQQKVIIRFEDARKVAPIRSYLKKDKDGWYYEQNL